MASSRLHIAVRMTAGVEGGGFRATPGRIAPTGLAAKVLSESGSTTTAQRPQVRVLLMMMTGAGYYGGAKEWDGESWCHSFLVRGSPFET